MGRVKISGHQKVEFLSSNRFFMSPSFVPILLEYFQLSEKGKPTYMGASAATFTLQVADILPLSFAVTVIVVACPTSPITVITPFGSTVATVSSCDE